MRAGVRRLFLTAALGALAAGCTNELSSSDIDADTDTDGDALGQGEDCSGGGECAEGLICSGVDGTCQPDGAPGTVPEEGDCMASFDCQWGLVCASDGTCQQEGDSGTTGAGGSCEQDSDCLLFLECLDGVCQGFEPPYWPGTECEEPSGQDDPFIAYFEVGGDSGEFYRLPFPNDARVSGGRIDLEDHANPGVLIEELGNPVDSYFDAVEHDVDGFGLQSCTYFRFSHSPDWSTVNLGETIYMVDIDPDSEKYGEQAFSRFRGDIARGKYICNNWIALCPNLGRPLQPGTTYAAIVTTDVADAQGDAAEQSEDFAAMLAGSEPGEAGLSHAWTAYAPLRDYLDDQAINPTSIASAAVFTTGRPSADLPLVRDAVRAEPEPMVEGLAVDDSGDAYSLYSGELTVPFYQQGERPFATVEDGGGIDYDGEGMPVWVEDESVRFALTVPAGEAPPEGWPVIIYAHGTGGSEMSFVGNGTAERMAGVGVAAIGLEQVMHGERRGLSGDQADLEQNSPERLFYNFLNPRAARDNNVQAAADHFQLVRLIEGFFEITGEDVLFDTEKIYFFGHSQGSQGPMLFAAHEPLVDLLVLSGAGGYLIESLLGKKQPLDVSAAIRFALMEFGEVDWHHPLLNLIQLAFDPVDPATHARMVFRQDMSELGYPRRSVFMSYGIGDTYTPEMTQLALAKALGVQQWPLDDEHQLGAVPVIESLPHDTTYYYGNGVGVTAVTVQYEPDGDYDGHFVIFENADAVLQHTQFVGTMVTGGIPTLVAP
ncbi:MAG: hypothetical protein R6V85_08905 [Polyangia bacterium]